MIQVTLSHKNGVELLEPITIGIDPEKIVSTRNRGYYCECDYGETFDRRRETVVYQLNTSRAAILALITGSYVANTYLALTVIWSLDREHRPIEGTASYAFDLQEKYIVDIRDVIQDVNGTLTACRRIEYVPGSFVPVVIFVSQSFRTLVPDVPAVVTTTTEEPITTTTTEEESATTTEEPAVTTTSTELGN